MRPPEILRRLFETAVWESTRVLRVFFSAEDDDDFEQTALVLQELFGRSEWAGIVVFLEGG